MPDGLASLVEKSLLRHEEGPAGPVGVAGFSRFQMLETVREYAVERLAVSGEGESVRRYHAAYYLALATVAWSEVDGPAQATWLARLVAEHDNLRQALRWLLDCADFQAAQRLSQALHKFWQKHDDWGNRRAWQGAWRAALLDRPGGPPRTATAAAALTHAGLLTDYDRDTDAAVGLHEPALAIMRRLGDRPRMAASLHYLADLARWRGDRHTARARWEESLALAREVGDRRVAAMALMGLGRLADLDGDAAAASTRLEESAALAQAAGETAVATNALRWLSVLAAKRGDYPGARARLRARLTENAFAAAVAAGRAMTREQAVA